MSNLPQLFKKFGIPTESAIDMLDNHIDEFIAALEDYKTMSADDKSDTQDIIEYGFSVINLYHVAKKRFDNILPLSVGSVDVSLDFKRIEIDKVRLPNDKVNTSFYAKYTKTISFNGQVLAELEDRAAIAYGEVIDTNDHMMYWENLVRPQILDPLIKEAFGETLTDSDTRKELNNFLKIISIMRSGNRTTVEEALVRDISHKLHNTRKGQTVPESVMVILLESTYFDVFEDTEGFVITASSGRYKSYVITKDHVMQSVEHAIYNRMLLQEQLME